MFWFLFGVLLFLLIRNNFDLQGVKKDARKIARGIRKILKDLVRAVRNAAQEGKQKAAEPRQADPARADAESIVSAAPAEQAEVKENMELLKKMEQKAGTAAMLAKVPTIDFPADDPKYDSSRKYMYA